MASGKRIKKRTITLPDRSRTSVSMEDEFWSRFKEIAAKEAKTIGALVYEIMKAPGTDNVSSAIRLYVLKRGA